MTYIHVSFRICYGERKENEKRHDEEKSERETHEYVQENVGFTTQLRHFIPLYANGGPDIVRTCATLAWVHVSPTLTEELRCASNNRKFSHTDSLFSHIPSLSVQDNGLSLKNISLIFFFLGIRSQAFEQESLGSTLCVWAYGFISSQCKL